MYSTYEAVTSEKAKPIIGGWGEFKPLTDQEKEIFRTCMTLKGVDYTPLLVAKQLASGYNYRFICMTELLIREPKYGFAKVTIYAPLRGEARTREYYRVLDSEQRNRKFIIRVGT